MTFLASPKTIIVLSRSKSSFFTPAKPEPSPVLLALGLDPARAKASLRFGLGRSTTSETIDRAAARVVRAVEAQSGRETGAA